MQIKKPFITDKTGIEKLKKLDLHHIRQIELYQITDSEFFLNIHQKTGNNVWMTQVVLAKAKKFSSARFLYVREDRMDLLKKEYERKLDDISK